LKEARQAALAKHVPKYTPSQAARSLDTHIFELEERVTQLEAERDYAVMAYGIASAGQESANAHCTLAQRVNQDLTTRLHDITTKRPPTDNVFQGQKHGFLTTPEGKERHMAKVEAKQKAIEEKEREQAEKAQQLQDERLARLRLIDDPTHAFEGTITGLKYGRISTLRDVAATLGLDHDGITKPNIYEGIVAHFEQNPELKLCPRYQNLFSSRKAVGSSTHV
jgi:hypothetical protein